LSRGGLSVRTLVDESGRVVCEHCEVTASSLQRMRGLLGRKGLGENEGMLITRTSSVHTAFMAFPMDAVFLDKQLRVRKIVPAMRPWRAAWKRGCKSVLELAGGEAERAGIVVGSRLSWRDNQ
jgi:hypothetical protein